MSDKETPVGIGQQVSTEKIVVQGKNMIGKVRLMLHVTSEFLSPCMNKI